MGKNYILSFAFVQYCKLAFCSALLLNLDASFQEFIIIALTFCPHYLSYFNLSYKIWSVLYEHMRVCLVICIYASIIPTHETLEMEIPSTLAPSRHTYVTVGLHNMCMCIRMRRIRRRAKRRRLREQVRRSDTINA